MDLIDEVREEAMKGMAKHKEAMARYYNRKVKERRFNAGDLVLRKISQATKDLSQEKLGPAPRKTGTSLGRPLRSNLSLQKRLLLPKVFRQPGIASTMEHRTLEEILPIRNTLHFKLPNLHISMYDSFYFRHS